MAGVFDDGDDVGAFLSHIEEIAARSVGEFHCIDQPLLKTKTRSNMSLEGAESDGLF